jgi:hypothetical protein
MKRTQNVLNDGKRESRLPEPITRTQQSREEEEPRVEQNTGRSLDVCLIGSQRLILHIPHGFSFEKKKKIIKIHKSPKRKKRKEESTEPPASAPYRKSKGEGEKSAQPEGIFV